MGHPEREAAAVAPDLDDHPNPELERAPLRPLDITISAEGADLVLAIEGEVDLSTAPTLRTCLEHSAADSCGKVVLDLSGVTFLDSSGIAAIVRTHRTLAGTDRRLVLRNPRRAVQRVLTISGIDGVIDVELPAPPSG
jgi:anti-anti-sigma factor